MASLASQRASSPRAAAPGGRRAGAPGAAGPRAARPPRQREKALTIEIPRAAWDADVAAGWQAFRLTARCPAGLDDQPIKDRFERAAAELLRECSETSGGAARTAGTFTSQGEGPKLVILRLAATVGLWEELQRRVDGRGWVDLGTGGRDPAWPGFAAVSTAADAGEREVALVGLPTGLRSSALTSRLRDAGWPISRSFRPTHPTLGVKRDNAVVVVVPAAFALPETVVLAVEGGDIFTLQVKPESKLPPAPRLPGQATASWAAVAAGGAPGAPAAAHAPAPAATHAPAPAAAGPSANAPAGAGAKRGKTQRECGARQRSRSRSQAGAGAAGGPPAGEPSRGRNRSRSPGAAAADRPAADQPAPGLGRARGRSRNRSPAEGHELPAAGEGAGTSAAAAGGESGGQEGFKQCKKPRRCSPRGSRSPSPSPSPSPPSSNRFTPLADADEGEAADAMTDG